MNLWTSFEVPRRLLGPNAVALYVFIKTASRQISSAVRETRLYVQTPPQALMFAV